MSTHDVRALRRDKYGDDPEADMAEDLARLSAGEPLAYVIGWVPFLGLRIHLEPGRTLIPRPETECWTGVLIAHLREKFGDKPFRLLDLCAGSGAIGLAVLHALPKARVTFAEVDPALEAVIRRNAQENGFDEDRFSVCVGDLFETLPEERYDVIATNPPYVPEGRVLDPSVTDHEPAIALYAGTDGLNVIRRIAEEAHHWLTPGGELWLECDTGHAEEVQALLTAHGASASIRTDQYGRPRLLVAYWSHG